MLVNAHDHFEFYRDLNSGLKTIQDFKIHTLVNTMTLKEYYELKSIHKNNELLKIGLGIHPWKIEENTSIDDLEKEFEFCDFIGEIGLDFYWDKRAELYDKQRIVFDYFLQKAQKYQKITNIHTKGAEKEVLYYLKKYNLKTPIIHWYSGPLNLVSDFLELGCYFTIGPDIGYSKLTDSLIDIVPVNKILTETDGPTSIEWVNGIYAESDYIIKILEYISLKKKMEFNTLKFQIFQNYKNLGLL